MLFSQFRTRRKWGGMTVAVIAAFDISSVVSSLSALSSCCGAAISLTEWYLICFSHYNNEAFPKRDPPCGCPLFSVSDYSYCSRRQSYCSPHDKAGIYVSSMPKKKTTRNVCIYFVWCILRRMGVLLASRPGISILYFISEQPQNGTTRMVRISFGWCFV